jgi:hypothetical protein
LPFMMNSLKPLSMASRYWNFARIR